MPSAFLSFLVLMPCRRWPFWSLAFDQTVGMFLWNEPRSLRVSPAGYRMMFCTSISSRCSALSGSRAIRWACGRVLWDVKER